MSPEAIGSQLGQARIEPATRVEVGSYGTWRIIYTAGRFGMDDDAQLRIIWRFATDWGRPQTSDPQADNYVTCHTTGNARTEVSYQWKGHKRPWFHAVTVRVFEGNLWPGDQIVVTLGDTSGGSAGQQAPTACDPRSEMRILVDCCGVREFLPLPEPLYLPIVSGPAAELEIVAPTVVAVGQPFRVLVRAMDRWGNPAAGYRGHIEFSAEGGAVSGLPRSYTFAAQDGGVRTFDGLRLEQPGACFCLATDVQSNLSARSNPIVCFEDPGPCRPFWGDLHGQSVEALGLGTAHDYFRFARDVAGVDFASNQGNDFDITAEGWKRIQEAVKQYHEPSRFVPFLGFEWSGNVSGGGDHNVLFLRDDEPLIRSGHWCVDPDDGEARYPLSEAYEGWRGREDVLLTPHVGGRYANFDFHDPAMEPAIEVYSSWGYFEWFLQEALDRGMQVGFVAGSDDHKGRPGASHPGASAFGVRGGLTCLLATELTREALWDALRARRCYATSGARIHLEFSSDGHPMGAAYESSGRPYLMARAIGASPLERIELWRDGERVHFIEPPAEGLAQSPRIRVAWSGLAARKVRYFRAVWDGRLEIRDGRIVSVEPYAFDSPLEGIVSHDEHSIAWRSVTHGDADGVILTLQETPQTSLRFATEVVDFALNLRDLGATPRVYSAGGVNRQVEVRRLPLSPGPMELSMGWTDNAAPPGRHAYYVKAIQSDGHFAISSPVYLTLRPG